MPATIIPILKVQNPTSPCPWCRRLLKVIDGERDLNGLARELGLPHQVVRKLLHSLVNQGQVQVNDEHFHAPTPLWEELHRTLLLVVPEKAATTLSSAMNMTRSTPQSLRQLHLPDVMLALEFSLSSDDYQAFTLHWTERQAPPQAAY